MFALTPDAVALIAATFVFAGFIKGVIGMGFPTISLVLLAATLGLKPAMVLILAPSTVMNIWQGAAGGRFRALLGRLWPLLAVACLGIWTGAGVLARADAVWLAALLGLMLFAYSAFSLARAELPRPGAHERWLSPAVGGITGLITGMTGSFIMPAVLYMSTLGLKKDELVQAMGIAFTVANTMLALALAGHGLFPRELGLASLLGLVPALGGMGAGILVRKRLSEERFRLVFFTVLMLVGGWLAVRPLVFY